MDRQFFSGNTLEQAILAAARHHGLDPERVAYTLRDKKHGFVNIRRRVVIEVDPAAPEQTEQARSEGEAPAAPVEPSRSDEGRRRGGQVADRPDGGHRHQPDDGRDGPIGGESLRRAGSWRGQEASWGAGEEMDPGRQEDAAVEKALEVLSELLDVELVPSIRREEDGLEIDLSGSESGVLREQRGEGLGAVEHLLPRMVRGLNGQGVPCRVDSEGFRAAYEAELRRLARSEADEVRRELEDRRLEPMNPADRRVIHLALADDPAVTTQSEGRGLYKRVKIMPA